MGNRILSQYNHVVLGLSAFLMASIGGGCANLPDTNQFVSNVQVKSYQLNGDDWIQANATFSTGGFTLASINVPVTDPRDRTRVYGQFTLTPTLCQGICQGGGDLTLALNLTQSAHVSGFDPLLPNGTALPIGGFDPNVLVALPVGNTGARLYFAFAPGVAILGTAVPFAQLDPAGQYVPGVDIFQPFKAGPVMMTAGVFFGAAPNTTGVGFFMDLNGVINPPATNPAILAEFAPSESIVKLKAVQPSLPLQYKAYRKLSELSQKNLVLEVK